MLVKKMELTIAEDILMALNEKPAEFLKDMRDQGVKETADWYKKMDRF